VTLTATAPPGTTVTPLAARWLDLLRDGNNRDYQNDGAAVMAVAVAMVRAGFSYADYHREMFDPNNQLAASWYQAKTDGRHRNAPAASRKMRTEWGKAVRYAADHPQVHDRAEALQQLGVVKAAVVAAAWTGRSAIRNRSILGIIVAAGEQHGTMSPALSLRTICEQSAYRHYRTVANAVAALRDLGWVEVEPSSDASMPNSYRLRVPGKCLQRAHISVFPGGDTAVHGVDTSGGGRVHGVDTSSGGRVRVANTLDDLAVNGPAGHPRDRIDNNLALALGPHAALVYATLDPDIPQNPTTLIRRSGLARQTVYKWLKQLAQLGLARKSRSLWLAGDTPVEVVASDYEVTAVAADRALRHGVERQGWREYVAAGGPGLRGTADPGRAPATKGRKTR
jgi:hypothetical protein